ncbi:MAG: ABC transporter ATP-binding protein [Clostridia bacterium]|nr:ABC transporter ATP-binding protein [Clostridia bacterium]
MKIENLSVSFEDKVIFKDFSCEFEKNKVTAIMGNSGVGKTTLLNAIAKLVPFNGQILGVDGVSYMFQEPRLVDISSVYDNLSLVLPDDEKNKHEKILDLVKKVELENELDTFCGELSGGMKSRVALARAFLRDKEVLLMDEPMRSLDIGLRKRLWDLLKKLLMDKPKTTLLVTHDVDEAIYLADRIVVLSSSPCQIALSCAVTSHSASELKALVLEKLVK